MPSETVHVPQNEQVSTAQASSATKQASIYRVLLLLLLALTAGSSVTLWIEKSRYEKFSGYLQARLRTVASPREAKIARLLVSPGAEVAAGQPLVVLEDASFESRMRDKRHEVTSLEIELTRTRAALEVELDLQQRDISDRIFETKWRSAQLLRRQIFAPSESPFSGQVVGGDGGWQSFTPRGGLRSAAFDEGDVRRTSSESLLPTPAGSPLQVSRAELDLCNDHICALEKMSRELPDKVARSMGIDLVEARLAHAQAELSALADEQRELTLVAEAAGLVGVFHKSVGDRVLAHEPIVQVLDEEQPFLVLQFPSPRISDFAPGTVVDLRFPGGRKGKGRVEAIPPQTSDMPAEPGASRETVITAHVDPVGSLWPSLPFGSVVEVRRKR